MKSLFNKLLSVILCLVLAVCLFSIDSFANTVEYDAPDKGVSLSGLPINSDEPIIVIDPTEELHDYIVEKLTDRDQMAKAANKSAVMPNNSSYFTDSLYFACLQLRQELMSHPDQITIYYKAPYENLDEYSERYAASAVIWKFAMEVTGNPMEGDYLRRSIPYFLINIANVASDDNTVMYVGFSYTPYYRGNLTYAQEQQMAAAADAVIESLGFTSCTSGYDKIKAIYKWIGDNIIYETDTNPSNDLIDLDQTAYSAIINRKTVCAGYSHLMYYMMWKCGIPCRIISGQGGVNNVSDPQYNHAWDIVWLRGQWYSMDVTWDAGEEYSDPCRFNYFLRGRDNGFYSEHFTNRDSVAPDPYGLITFDNTSLVSASCPTDYGARRTADNGKCSTHTTASSSYKTDSGTIVHWCSVCGQSVIGTWPVGPTITSQPANVSVPSGSKAIFTVVATGSGTLKYQWQWSADGTTWYNTSLTGYNTATLTVTASSSVNGRYYRCVVSDSQGSTTSSPAKLTVTLGPTITAQPKNRSVGIGNKAYFTVTATGTGTLKYQWQYSTDGTTWYNTALTGCNTPTLTVTASAAINGRYYRCVVSDDMGSVNSAAAKLFVTSPGITSQPKSVTVSSGSKAAFTVTAMGTGTLTYQWQYSTNGTNWYNTSLSGYNTPTLTVTASAAVNGRYYRCVVSDSKGSVTSSAAKLTITPGPAITAQPQNQTVTAGSKALFTVTATGSGTLTYQWQYSTNGTTWYNTALTGCNTPTLTVVGSSAVNGRYYRCVVTDANGSIVSNAARLTVTPGPTITGQPQNQTVAVGSKASFTIMAAGSGTLTFQWQYSDNGTTWANTALTGCNTATLTVTATSAINGRYYRCVVTDANGSIVSNAARLIVTPAPTITGQPQSQTVAVGSKASFTVTATGSGSLSYQWQYSDNGTTWANTALTGCNTATLTVTATSAINGRYYRCMVTDANGSIVSSAARLIVT